MLKAGEKKGVAREVSFYIDKKKKRPMVAVKLEVISPDQGEIVYQGICEGKHATFTGRDLRALGWTSDKLAHAKAEIEAAAAVVTFTVEYQTYTKNNGDIGEFPVVRSIGVSNMPEHSLEALAAAEAAEAAIASYEAQHGKYATPEVSDDVPF